MKKMKDANLNLVSEFDLIRVLICYLFDLVQKRRLIIHLIIRSRRERKKTKGNERKIKGNEREKTKGSERERKKTKGNERKIEKEQII